MIAAAHGLCKSARASFLWFGKKAKHTVAYSPNRQASGLRQQTKVACWHDSWEALDLDRSRPMFPVYYIFLWQCNEESYYRHMTISIAPWPSILRT